MNEIKTSAFTLIAAALATSAAAQNPIQSVTVTLSATASGVTQTYGPASMPTSGASASFSQSNASASVQVAPVAAVPGAEKLVLSASGFASIPSFSTPAGSFSLSADILLVLDPAAGSQAVVALGWLANGLPGQSLSVDVGDDGSLELAETSLPLGQTHVRELGSAVAAGGTPVRVAYSAAVWAAVLLLVSSQLQAAITVYPDSSPIEPYGSSCLDLSHGRPAASRHDRLLVCATPGSAPVLFLFGLNQLSSTLPWAPGCMQLTDVLGVIPVAPTSGMATLPLPGLALPPGASFRAQCATFLGTDDVRTSNGLVMTGF